MSSSNLYTLINEFPEERAAIERLVQHICWPKQQGKTSQNFKDMLLNEREWTIQRLFDIAHPSSQRVLARILVRLVDEGVLKQTVRVESVTKGNIGDFDSITDVPHLLFDEFIGHEVEVNMDSVRMIYKTHSTS